MQTTTETSTLLTLAYLNTLLTLPPFPLDQFNVPALTEIVLMSYRLTPNNKRQKAVLSVIGDHSAASSRVTSIMIIISVQPKLKIWKEPRLLYFGVPTMLSSLGSSQFRFQYNSIRFHMIRNLNGPEMGPYQYRKEKNTNNLHKTLYQNPGIQQYEQEPKYWN